MENVFNVLLRGMAWCHDLSCDPSQHCYSCRNRLGSCCWSSLQHRGFLGNAAAVSWDAQRCNVWVCEAPRLSATWGVSVGKQSELPRWTGWLQCLCCLWSVSVHTFLLRHKRPQLCSTFNSRDLDCKVEAVALKLSLPSNMWSTWIGYTTVHVWGHPGWPMMKASEKRMSKVSPLHRGWSI